MLWVLAVQKRQRTQHRFKPNRDFATKIHANHPADSIVAISEAPSAFLHSQGHEASSERTWMTVIGGAAEISGHKAA